MEFRDIVHAKFAELEGRGDQIPEREFLKELLQRFKEFHRNVCTSSDKSEAFIRSQVHQLLHGKLVDVLFVGSILNDIMKTHLHHVTDDSERDPIAKTYIHTVGALSSYNRISMSGTEKKTDKPNEASTDVSG